MKKVLPWLLLLLTSIGLLAYFLLVPKVQLGGDIVEYYGTTESLINHQSFELRPQDRTNLEKVLHPAYFTDPGYYITGRNDQRYPVHFVFYSVLATPVRLVLRVLQLPEIKALWITNVLLFCFTCAFIFFKYLKTNWLKVTFLILFLLSPLISFFIWPGPDLLYVCLVMISVFAFFNKKYLSAVAFATMASWHSQPLIIYTAGLTLYALGQHSHFSLVHRKLSFTTDFISDLKVVATSLLVFVPYLYNLFAFGVLTPWTILQDGWTELYGFGLQNLSLYKLFEQFFDLNMGLVWYAPLLLVIGAIFALVKIVQKNKAVAFITLLSIVTAFFYQTNPGWHYGTSGFGPTRHILFIIPLLIYLIVSHLKPSKAYFALLSLIVAVQVLALSMNNYLQPDLTKTLVHTPIAEYVMQNYPRWYRPNPEIFADRTNHADKTYPTTAIYKVKDTCYKAYVLLTDKLVLESECGNMSAASQLVEDPYQRTTNFERKVTVYEATLWPDPESCAPDYLPGPTRPFICLSDKQKVEDAIGVENSKRIATLPDFPYPGVWKITSGKPITITLPPGYIMDYRGIEGVYVDFK